MNISKEDFACKLLQKHQDLLLNIPLKFRYIIDNHDDRIYNIVYENIVTDNFIIEPLINVKFTYEPHFKIDKVHIFNISDSTAAKYTYQFIGKNIKLYLNTNYNDPLDRLMTFIQDIKTYILINNISFKEV